MTSESSSTAGMLTRELQFRRYLEDSARTLGGAELLEEVLTYALDFLEVESGALCRMSPDGHRVDAMQGLSEEQARRLAREVANEGSPRGPLELSAARSAAGVPFSWNGNLEALVVLFPDGLRYGPETEERLRTAASCVGQALELADLRREHRAFEEKDSILRLIHGAVGRGVDSPSLVRLVLRQLVWRCEAARAFAGYLDENAITVLDEVTGQRPGSALHLRRRYALDQNSELLQQLLHERVVVSTASRPVAQLGPLHRALRADTFDLVVVPLEGSLQLLLGAARLGPGKAAAGTRCRNLLHAAAEELSLALRASLSPGSSRRRTAADAKAVPGEFSQLKSDLASGGRGRTAVSSERRRLRAMQRLVRVGGERLQPDQVAEQALEALLSAVDAEGGAVFTVAPGSDQLALGSGGGFDADFLTDTIRHIVAAHVLVEKTPLLVDGLDELPEALAAARPSLQAQGVGALAAMPLFARDRSVGVLVMVTRRAKRWTDADGHFLSLAAYPIATALDAARLHRADVKIESMAEPSGNLRALAEALRDISAELETPALLDRVMKKVVEAIPDAQAASLLLREGPHFLFVACEGYDLERLRQIRFPAERMVPVERPGSWDAPSRVVGWESINVGVLSPADYENLSSAGRLGEIRVSLVAPVRLGEELRGWLTVDNFERDGAFDEAAADVLQLFANHVAVALRNARLYDALRQSEGRYHDLFESLSEGIIYFDRRGKIEFINEAVARNLGVPREKLLGLDYRDFMTGVRSTDVDPGSALDVVLAEGRSFDWSHPPLEFVAGTGASAVVMEVRLSPRYRGDVVVGAVGTFRYVTEERRLRAEKRELRGQLVQAERLSALGRLVAGIAHELNNPLTGVMGFTELLLMQKHPSAVAEKLKRIHGEADRCRRIVQSLMAFARRQPVEKKPLHLGRLVNEALDLQAYRLRVTNIEVVREVPPDLPLVEGDPHQLHQAMLNIVTNAYDAMAPSGKPGRLTVRGSSVEGLVRLEFQDTGPGIESDHLRRIFDPFFTTKQVGQGSGLGLSLVYGVVIEHGGRVWAETEPGAGTTITMELPAPDPVRSERLQKTRSDTAGPPRLLVVDDEESVAFLVAEVGAQLGFEAEVVQDGTKALARFSRERFDLVVCDLRMPGLSGFELFERVREHSATPPSNFVFVTGDVVTPGTLEFLESCGRPYLLKPFNAAELRDALCRVLPCEKPA